MLQQEVKNQLHSFIELSELIHESQFFSETKNITFQLNYKEGEGTKMAMEGVNEDHFRSALIDFRKAYMQGEQTNFYVICNLIETNYPDGDFKNKIR